MSRPERRHSGGPHPYPPACIHKTLNDSGGHEKCSFSACKRGAIGILFLPNQLLTETLLDDFGRPVAQLGLHRRVVQQAGIGRHGSVERGARGQTVGAAVQLGGGHPGSAAAAVVRHGRERAPAAAAVAAVGGRCAGRDPVARRPRLHRDGPHWRRPVGAEPSLAVRGVGRPVARDGGDASVAVAAAVHARAAVHSEMGPIRVRHAFLRGEGES